MRRSILAVVLVAGCANPTDFAETPTAASPTPTPTLLERARVFDGYDDCLASDGGNVGGPWDPPQLTVDAWVNPSSLVQDGNIVDHSEFNDNPPEGWALALIDGHPAVKIFHPEMSAAIAPALLPLNQWSFLSATIDGAKLAIFVDGQLVGSFDAPSAADPFPINSVLVGGLPFDHPVHGLVDEVRISGVIRYDASFDRPTARFEPDADTIALWHFDEETDPTDSASGWDLHICDVEPSTAPHGPASVSVPPIDSR